MAPGRQAFIPLPLVPLVPLGRPGATVRDRCLLGVQIAAIPGGIGVIFRGIMAPVLGQGRPGALGPDRGSLDCQLASRWRQWRLTQQGQARFFADDHQYMMSIMPSFIYIEIGHKLFSFIIKTHYLHAVQM